jgi:hypothetical protein
MQPLEVEYEPLAQSSRNYELQHPINNYSPRRGPSTMARLTTVGLTTSMALLMLSCGIELAMISSMVYWLHYRAGKDFVVNYNGSDFPLHGKPAGLLVNQGHTSNGAAGTEFVAVGLGGIVALWLRGKASMTPRSSSPHLHRFSKVLYNTWFTLVFLGMLLTIAALIYTMTVTAIHDGQTIDVALAAGLDNHPYPNYVAYPLQQWTPENWFTAVLQLNLVSSADRSSIQAHLDVMKGWRWNLIPMTVFSILVFIFAVLDRQRFKREERVERGYGDGKRISA